MKKLAIVLLLVVVAGCKRQVVVTSAPSTQPSSSANANASGGATHREALTRFMAAARAQDIQAVSNSWGTSKGPVRNDRTFMSVEEMEQRIIYMLRCLRHDSYAIRVDRPAVGGERIFEVELKLRTLTAVTDFTTTPGPEGRFYVRILDLDKLQGICSST